MVELFANSRDPDQTPDCAASDLDLHCFPITLLGVASLKWVKWPQNKIYIIVYYWVIVGDWNTCYD